MDGWTDGWMDGWMDELMDGWMDGRMRDGKSKRIHDWMAGEGRVNCSMST